MSEKRITIDPAQFTDSQWQELYNASTILPRSLEAHATARPVNRPTRYVELAAAVCRTKADEVKAGNYPSAKGKERARWVADLRGAAAALDALLKPKAPIWMGR